MYAIIDDYGNILYQNKSKAKCKAELREYEESEEYAGCVYLVKLKGDSL